MDWLSFASSAAGAIIGTIPVGVIVTKHLEHNLVLRQKRRDANAAVIEILAKWVRPTYLGRPMTDEERWDLQTTYWKNILLLDKEIIAILFPRLANKPDAVGTNDVIVEVRTILLKQRRADIAGKDLNTW